MMSAEMPGDAKKMFDSIEDIIAQADEVDEKYLQVKEEFFECAMRNIANFILV